MTPTPIQAKAIPEVLQGRDVMGLAQTGTGKTAAFALPILQRLLEAEAGKRGPVRTLVLAPTRELALQIYENFIDLGKQTGIRCAAVFGGVGMNPQIKAVRQATVVVACPGRLNDLLNQGVISLDHVDTLVLDEADRMLDMGFLPDIKRVMARLPEKRQNLLFSATMPSDIKKLADRILENPALVQVANTAPAKQVSHAFYPVNQHLKGSLLEALLKQIDHDSVIVFTRTKHRAKNLARKLDRIGHAATFLQGNMTQNQRQRALDGFRQGTFRVMVATDIAARGIDCDRISHVINFDIPDTAETYTHRIGRTGRAGRSGQALTLITPEDRQMVRDIERTLRMSIEQCVLDDFDYDKLQVLRGGGREEQPKNGRRRPGGGGSNRRPKRFSRRESRA
ncbi:DEAD/DEAH box helicase [Salidesulfovibrio onnuriiensis]|uniref:DEAD/DEAH box helicase n=1 Tax=Salidesulfovibrio onnuriiensis TaxID=2583823 RepID=UPI0032B7EA75